MLSLHLPAQYALPALASKEYLGLVTFYQQEHCLQELGTELGSSEHRTVEDCVH